MHARFPGPSVPGFTRGSPPSIARQFGYSRDVPKARTIYVCDSCGSQQPKWQGQCPDCGAWNTLNEAAAPAKRAERAQYTGSVELTRLDRVDVARVERLGTGLGEFDRVLGGGLVPGGVVLLGGDPGIGKSTLLLRALADLAPRVACC
jgi:DNA repair protein RadA/Sms